MKTINLDIKDVIRNARKAYDAGALQAQDLNNSSGQCSYAGPCAIGVSIPVELRETLDNAVRWEGDTSIDHLIRLEVVHVEDSEARKDLTSLQMDHDDWVAHGPNNERAKTKFLKTLINLEDKYGVAA